MTQDEKILRSLASLLLRGQIIILLQNRLERNMWQLLRQIRLQ